MSMKIHTPHADTLADLAAAHDRIRDLESENADLKRRLRRIEAMQPEPMARRGEGVMSLQVDDARLLSMTATERHQVRDALLDRRGVLWGRLREAGLDEAQRAGIVAELRVIQSDLEGMRGDRRGQGGSNQDPNTPAEDPKSSAPEGRAVSQLEG